MGNNLEYFRKKAGITRAELASLVNVDRTLIWRYEKGLCQPRDEVKVRIAKALGKTVEEIFFSPGVACDTTEQSATAEAANQ